MSEKLNAEKLNAHIPVFLIDTRWTSVWDVSPKSTSLLLRKGSRASSSCSLATSLSCQHAALQLGQTRKPKRYTEKSDVE